MTELIDRYVEKTVRLLPAERRAEAAETLREWIRVRLDDRTREAASRSGEAAARPPLDDGSTAVEEVLLDLGPPEEVAASLRPGHDWLISPHLMPQFVTAVVVAVAGLALLTVVEVLTGPGGAPGGERSWFELLLRFVASLDDLLLDAVVVVTSIVALFVAMDRTVEGAAAARRRWSPRQLLTKDPNRVRRSGAVLEIALAGAALVALHLFHFTPGIFLTVGGESGWVPLVVPGLHGQFPWLDLWLVGSMALGIALLWTGRWGVLTHCGRAGLAVLMASIFWRVREAVPLFAVDAAWMADHGWSVEAIARAEDVIGGPLQEVLHTVVFWLPAVCLLIAGVELVRALRSAVSVL